MSSNIQPTTLWIWPKGMFPRRVLYYFKAKQLPASVLQQLTIIPVEIDTNKGALEALDGYEAKPAGYSLPVLRLNSKDKNKDDKSRYITQSSSILEYFEDLFPSTEGYTNLSGSDAESRARSRDVVFLVNEVFVWTNVYLRHTTELSRAWTGMTREEQSASAAADARQQVANFMEKLEDRMRDCLVQEGNVSITGGKAPRLADCNLHAAKAYIEEMYGWDIFEGRALLKGWFERYQQSRWGIGKVEMGRFAEGDFGGLFMGE